MIDYARIQRSIDFYETAGFKRIESPWTVTKPISAITKPRDRKDWEILNKEKVLVASGEQSFLYLYLKGFIPNGKFQTVTPCFREEPFDQFHTKYFMKNELIITDEVNESSLNSVVNTCKNFFENEFQKNVTVIETKEGFDIEIMGIELGSYGIRTCEYLKWIYATGCAEPRMTFIQKMINNGVSR